MAVEELANILRKSRSERNRHNAAQALLTIHEKNKASGASVDPEAAKFVEQLIARRQAQSDDPRYLGETVAHLIVAGLIILPNWFVMPTSPTTELVEDEPRKLLLEPEREPDQIEEAVIVEPCICECGPADHPGGGGCNKHERCHLYVSISEAIESRNPDPQT